MSIKNQRDGPIVTRFSEQLQQPLLRHRSYRVLLWRSVRSRKNKYTEYSRMLHQAPTCTLFLYILGPFFSHRTLVARYQQISQGLTDFWRENKRYIRRFGIFLIMKEIGQELGELSVHIRAFFSLVNIGWSALKTLGLPGPKHEEEVQGEETQKQQCGK